VASTATVSVAAEAGALCPAFGATGGLSVVVGPVEPPLITVPAPSFLHALRQFVVDAFE
jgi:hypothetical protein